VPLLETALDFARGDESNDNQKEDVALMFGLFVAYFEAVDENLTEITMENLILQALDENDDIDASLRD
jgi:hypothetical protein